MELQEAIEILELENDIHKITLDFLKKKYHKMALKNHPDKNGNTIKSKEKFQKINESYEVLKREIHILNNESTDDDEDINTNIYANNYMHVLNLFIDGIFKGELSSSIIKDIVSGCKEVSLKLFEELDKERSLNIYYFILKYKKIMHLSDNILKKVREILSEKFKDFNLTFILNPSLTDLFENNVYKLNHNGVDYIVPLWHGEVYFDTNDEKKQEMIVKCIPDLPENMEIDENNNLFVDLKISFTFSLLQQKTIPINIGKKLFEIELERLNMKRIQTYIFKNMGISQVVENDIYNIHNKSDIIIKITFCE